MLRHTNLMSTPALNQRCPQCCIQQALCFCSQIPKLDFQTKVIIIMHHLEQKISTNTARLALRCLTNSQLLYRGLKQQPVVMTQVNNFNHYHPLFLFPSLDAQTLTPELVQSIHKPIALLVPDGSWRQAKRMAKREADLKTIQCVKLPPGPPSRYRLRQEPNSESLSSFEAITQALAIIENSAPAKIKQMHQLFDLMVERFLINGGKKPWPADLAR